MRTSRLLLLALLLPPCFLGAQQDADCAPAQQINGRISISGETKKEYTIVLEKVDGKAIDSVLTREGHFVFCLPPDPLPYYVLRTREASRSDHYVLTDLSGPTTVLISLATGVNVQTDATPRYEQWMKDRTEIQKLFGTFLQERRRTGGGTDWPPVHRQIDRAFYDLLDAAFKRDPALGVALMRAEIARWESIQPSWETAVKLRDRLRNLSADLRNDPVVQFLLQTTNQHIFARPGAQALDFTLSGLYGNLISTKDHRGQYLLLDFWGSWCQPCLEKNEALRDQYEKLNAAGLVMLTVMMDYARQPFAETLLDAALENDPAYPWPQGVLFRDENSDEIVNYYRAYMLPRTVLIDPAGKVIAIDPGTADDLLEWMKKERK